MKPRIRTIKPEFFDDPETCDLPPLARLLFIGLWTQADRRGRLQDEPRRLKTRLLPHDRVDVDLLLDDLVAAGSILRYQQDGLALVWIKNFERHQAINHREPESTLPAYQEGVSTLRPCVPVRSRARTGVPGRAHGEREGNGNGNGKGTGREREGIGNDHLAVIDPRFEAFWKAYPNKKAKAAARRAWGSLHVDDGLLATMLAAIDTQKTWRTFREGFIPHPATWLNAQRWLDEPEPARENPKSRTAGNADALRAVLERRRATT